MPSTAESALPVLTHLIIPTIQRGRYYYHAHFYYHETKPTLKVTQLDGEKWEFEPGQSTFTAWTLDLLLYVLLFFFLKAPYF